jgi:precorrin-8X/cobalt-precorrin-8 methylmutase
MTAWEIKGWCPGALRPMQSGDGLVVRIRPPLGRLNPAQAQAIAEASTRHGNGILDLSARANLQLRGVTEASHGPLIDDLRAQGLIDPDIETESLRNLIVTPFRASLPPPAGEGRQPSRTTADPSASLPPTWGRAGEGGHPASPSSDDTDTLAATLTAALAQMPRLPSKFGFALDTGPRPMLTGASADIRVERAPDGRLILRPDGHVSGQPVTDLASDATSLVNWFVANGGISNGRGRMAALIAKGILPPGCTLAPAEPLPQPGPGLHPEGALVALAFGQMQAQTHARGDPEPPERPPCPIYETDGAAIYLQSFAMIRAEADLARFTPEEEIVAVRMIHAAGMVGLAPHIRFTPGMAIAARAALEAGAPILCDARMVSEGITRARLPADNASSARCNDPGVPGLAAGMGNTRSAAAVELWRPHLAGAVVAIGNAPTALFHLLNMLEDPACPRPAAIIGCPVGFVGAAESKDALMAAPPVPAVIVAGPAWRQRHHRGGGQRARQPEGMTMGPAR